MLLITTKINFFLTIQYIIDINIVQNKNRYFFKINLLLLNSDLAQKPVRSRYELEERTELEKRA